MSEDLEQVVGVRDQTLAQFHFSLPSSRMVLRASRRFFCQATQPTVTSWVTGITSNRLSRFTAQRWDGVSTSTRLSSSRTVTLMTSAPWYSALSWSNTLRMMSSALMMVSPACSSAALTMSLMVGSPIPSRGDVHIVNTTNITTTRHGAQPKSVRAQSIPRKPQSLPRTQRTKSEGLGLYPRDADERIPVGCNRIRTMG